MADSSLANPALLPPACNSSLLEKLDPDLLRRLDQALVDRRPPTYRAVYDQFALHAKGISYTAFYYYARRVRINAAMIEIANLASHDGPPSHELLPDILAHRLLEASLDENASPRLLHRLADAYRIASATHFARRRLAAQLDDAKHNARTREADDICKTVRQLAQLRHAEFLQGGPGAFRRWGEPVPTAADSPVDADSPDTPPQALPNDDSCDASEQL
jgi:hypothetical protein